MVHSQSSLPDKIKFSQMRLNFKTLRIFYFLYAFLLLEKHTFDKMFTSLRLNKESMTRGGAGVSSLGS